MHTVARNIFVTSLRTRSASTLLKNHPQGYEKLDSFGPETRRCELKSRSRRRIFHFSLQCQINMNPVFHIPEDGSEIELEIETLRVHKDKRVKSSRKYLIKLFHEITQIG